MIMIKPPATNFNAVNGAQLQQASSYFDQNQDGRLSQNEMTNAASTLRYFGNTFNNEKMTNYANVFGRMAYETSIGNRSLDANGDGQVSINGELSTAFRRNDPSLFERADLRSTVPPFPGGRTNFNSISRNNTNLLFQYADSNVDGKVSYNEMQQAKTNLGKFGYYQNYTNVLQRFMEEIDNGNPSVDANGDRSISYRLGAPLPTGLRAPAELDTIIGRNNPNQLEVGDMRGGRPFSPFPVGLRVAE